jgi:DNA-binding transcriptional ArsR family regulator
MRCVGPTFSEEDLSSLREDYGFTPALDELAGGLALYGHSTRLKIFALLDETEQMCVCDLAAVQGLSTSAISQHLAKLRMVRLVKFRREAQTLYYSLTDHPLNALVRAALAGARAAVSEQA